VVTLGDVLLASIGENVLDKVATLKTASEAAIWASLGVSCVSCLLNLTVMSSTVYCLLRVSADSITPTSLSADICRIATGPDFPSSAIWPSPTCWPACGSSWRPHWNPTTRGRTSPRTPHSWIRPRSVALTARETSEHGLRVVLVVELPFEVPGNGGEKHSKREIAEKIAFLLRHSPRKHFSHVRMTREIIHLRSTRRSSCARATHFRARHRLMNEQASISTVIGSSLGFISHTGGWGGGGEASDGRSR